MRSSSSRSLRRIAPTARSIGVERRCVGGRDVARRGADRRAPAAQPEREVRARQAARGVVARDDAGPARRAPDERLEQRGGGRVEVGERLVEEQQLGVVQHRARGRDALDHPARQDGDRVVRPRRHPDGLEDLVDARRAARRAGARGSAGSPAASGRGRASARARAARCARGPPSPRRAARARGSAPSPRVAAAARPGRAGASTCRRRSARAPRAWRLPARSA